MSTDDELTAISDWTDDEVAQDSVRATGTLYAAAVLEELALIELVERLNELNQDKMLSIGAGEASNLLHQFWDKSYKRMPPKRRAKVYARVFGGGDTTADDAPNEAFAGLWQDLVSALAEGSPQTSAAAAALRDNLADHTDETTTKAAVELRATLSELSVVLSDMELRTAYKADDIWQLVGNATAELGGKADVESARARAVSGALILGHLHELCAESATAPELVEAATAWRSANAAAA
ncbi:MAG: hypothetical protein ACR2LK_11750 [Solirubrobacteraceae bacterium]